ncbi:hypothetical protein [Nonomuraea cypriaca]|uniref:hypothetical protein n=1 Tax=Nonomuraea cypriaca TaxID=1187855 RepID=UPI001A9C88E2|nr:hypothetical protein [Nonomuraea cypriaca]
MTGASRSSCGERKTHETDPGSARGGQSIWLDNITRALLDEGTLDRYIAEYSVTGLTSNPTIFDLFRNRRVRLIVGPRGAGQGQLRDQG